MCEHSNSDIKTVSLTSISPVLLQPLFNIINILPGIIYMKLSCWKKEKNKSNCSVEKYYQAAVVY